MAAASQSVLRINFLHKCAQPAFKVGPLLYMCGQAGMHILHACRACTVQVRPSIFLLHYNVCGTTTCANKVACSEAHTALNMLHSARAVLASPPPSTFLVPHTATSCCRTTTCVGQMPLSIMGFGWRQTQPSSVRYTMTFIWVVMGWTHSVTPG